MPPKCERCNKAWWECKCGDEEDKLDDSPETEEDYCQKCGNQWAECSCDVDQRDLVEDLDYELDDDERLWDEDEEDFE